MENYSNEKTIVLLHFAGGNCYSFNFLKKYLPNVKVVSLELPGRGRRIRESLLYNMDQAVDDLLQQFLLQNIQGDYLIYGHSMGATHALLLTSKLEKMHGMHPPVHVVATGNYIPVGKKKKETYQLPTDELKQVLKDFGGLSNELLEEDELFEYFEPVIRADLELLEKETIVLHRPVQTPIKVIMGSEEEGVEQIDNWKELTMSECSREVWSGNHFFIHQHAERLAHLLNNFFLNKIIFEKDSTKSITT